MIVDYAPVQLPACMSHVPTAKWSSAAAVPPVETDFPISARIGYLFNQFSPVITSNRPGKKSGFVIIVNNELRVINERVINIESELISGLEHIDLPFDFKAQLETVQSAFGLSVTQLSELLGVTRKSVYDWFDGAAPRSATTKRMDALLTVISENSGLSDISKLKGVWNIPVSGVSFRALLADEKLDVESLQGALLAKFSELAPRLAVEKNKQQGAYLGTAHTSEHDRAINAS